MACKETSKTLLRFREFLARADRERRAARGAGSWWPLLRVTLKQGGQVTTVYSRGAGALRLLSSLRPAAVP